MAVVDWVYRWLSKPGVWDCFCFSIFLNITPILKSSPLKYIPWQPMSNIHLITRLSVSFLSSHSLLSALLFIHAKAQGCRTVLSPSDPFTESLVHRLLSQNHSEISLEWCFSFCLLRDSHFFSLSPKQNCASCHGNIFEIRITFIFHHDLLWYYLYLL